MAGGYTVVGKLCGSAITSIIHLALLVCLHRSFANLERPFAQINPHNEAPNQPPWAKSHLRFLPSFSSSPPSSSMMTIMIYIVRPKLPQLTCPLVTSASAQDEKEGETGGRGKDRRRRSPPDFTHQSSPEFTDSMVQQRA